MLASRLCRTLWIAIVALGASGEARAGPPAACVAPRIAAADGDWLELPPPRGRRRGHTAIFDAAHDRMVVFGGTAFQVTLNETWQLAFAGDPGVVRDHAGLRSIRARWTHRDRRSGAEPD